MIEPVKSPRMLECQVGQGAVEASVMLVESVEGAGDWSVTGVRIKVTDGSTLTADRLRNFAWAGLLQAARNQASQSGARSPFARPSDPPAAFRVSRRGKAARTDEDYAQLAMAYLAFAPERRRKAAAEWSARFGREPGRWRADIANAKQYIDRDGEMLTDDGLRLAYGESIFASLEAEADAIDAEEWIALMGPSGQQTLNRAAERDRVARWARSKGMRVEEGVRELLRQRTSRVDEFYSGE